MSFYLMIFAIFSWSTAAQAWPGATPRPEATSCLHCHGNLEPLPPSDGEAGPMLPRHFSMRWNMYEFDDSHRPPLDMLPAALRVSRGETHYDWDRQSMVETYFDRCINIFPGGNEFSCQFISIKNTTHHVRYALGDLSRPLSCCRWTEGDFWAPRPDVLKNMSLQRSGRRDSGGVRWWHYEIPLPGPFGYGTSEVDNRPIAFWFPVIGAWVQQEFSDFSDAKPPAERFNLPAVCTAQVSVCE